MGRHRREYPKGRLRLKYNKSNYDKDKEYTLYYEYTWLDDAPIRKDTGIRVRVDDWKELEEAVRKVEAVNETDLNRFVHGKTGIIAEQFIDGPEFVIETLSKKTNLSPSYLYRILRSGMRKLLDLYNRRCETAKYVKASSYTDNKSICMHRRSRDRG